MGNASSKNVAGESYHNRSGNGLCAAENNANRQRIAADSSLPYVCKENKIRRI